MTRHAARLLVLMFYCLGQVFASPDGDLPPSRCAKRSVRTHEELKNVIAKCHRTPLLQAVEKSVAAQNASENLAITHLKSAFRSHAHAAPMYFKVALELSKHPRVHANVYLGLGKLFYMGEVKGELVDPDLCYRRAFEIARKEGFVAEKIFSCIGRGSVALCKTPPQHEVAKGHFLDALHFCGDHNTVMRARVFVWLGVAGEPFYRAGPRDENDLPMLRLYTPELCYKEALDSLRVPLGILKESAREVGLVAYKKLAWLCMFQGRYPEAIQWCLEAEKMTPAGEVVSKVSQVQNTSFQTPSTPPFTFDAPSMPDVLPPSLEDLEDPCEALPPLVLEEELSAYLEGNL